MNPGPTMTETRREVLKLAWIAPPILTWPGRPSFAWADSEVGAGPGAVAAGSRLTVPIRGAVASVFSFAYDVLTALPRIRKNPAGAVSSWPPSFPLRECTAAGSGVSVCPDG